MLTSFFGKSSPINYLLLSIFLVLFCVLHGILTENSFSQGLSILQLFVVAGLLVFSLLLLDFFVRKNHLNHSNTFAIFLFSCMVGMLPIATNVTITGALVLQLLAFRRIFSFTSSKNMERKILDASLWIFLASYFYFWSLLLFGVLYIALFKVNNSKLRYYFIPFIAALGVFLLATAFFYLKEDSFTWFFHYPKKISLDFSVYGNIQYLIFITLIVSIVIWTGFTRISNLSEVPKKNRGNYMLIVHAVWVSLVLAAFSPQKTGAELLYVIAPTAIQVGTFLEKKQDIWFKELLAWLFLILPVTLLFI